MASVVSTESTESISALIGDMHMDMNSIDDENVEGWPYRLNVSLFCALFYWNFAVPIQQLTILILFRTVLNEIDITDIANYPSTLSQSLHERIIRTGPVQVDIKFLSNGNRKSFSTSYYAKQMLNGEKIKREWMVYSNKVGRCSLLLLFSFRS